ncbi:hypothetical protein K505DRAFT_396097 [Melanomma pulvis-pyrius CBS 109.77]|uniref:Uncharacterized protein n=1 Tax=Melanomma pulvis-pyrius CBS 109.77 TaxID=1314802 RepID=A0A6A6WUI3_9PLEO|nr:hypothetical protein K505DRAFT_396097 [Melanomma pulvis-pyrius CBS 109.77]
MTAAYMSTTSASQPTTTKNIITMVLLSTPPYPPHPANRRSVRRLRRASTTGGTCPSEPDGQAGDNMFDWRVRHEAFAVEHVAPISRVVQLSELHERRTFKQVLDIVKTGPVVSVHPTFNKSYGHIANLVFVKAKNSAKCGHQYAKTATQSTSNTVSAATSLSRLRLRRRSRITLLHISRKGFSFDNSPRPYSNDPIKNQIPQKTYSGEVPPGFLGVLPGEEVDVEHLSHSGEDHKDTVIA